MNDKDAQRVFAYDVPGSMTVHLESGSNFPLPSTGAIRWILSLADPAPPCETCRDLVSQWRVHSFSLTILHPASRATPFVLLFPLFSSSSLRSNPWDEPFEAHLGLFAKVQQNPPSPPGHPLTCCADWRSAVQNTKSRQLPPHSS